MNIAFVLADGSRANIFGVSFARVGATVRASGWAFHYPQTDGPPKYVTVDVTDWIAARTIERDGPPGNVVPYPPV
jgi:hypothetical protein